MRQVFVFKVNCHSC